MALPTKTDLITLDYAWRGGPFANLEAKSLTTTTLDYAWRGYPFVAVTDGGGGGPPPSTDICTYIPTARRRRR